MSFHNQRGLVVTNEIRANLLEYSRMLRCVFVGLTYAIPRKAFNGSPGRIASRSHVPYEITKFSELLFVVTIELELWGRVDDNPSIEFPLAEHYRGTNTRISRHNRLCWVSVSVVDIQRSGTGYQPNGEGFVWENSFRQPTDLTQ